MLRAQEEEHVVIQVGEAQACMDGVSVSAVRRAPGNLEGLST